MALIVFQHHAVEPPDRLGDILRDYGHRLRVVELFQGDPVPVDLDDVDGVVSLGGPMNVDEQDQHPWMPREIEFIRQAHEAKLPVVGICLGAQLIATALGGRVEAMAQPEIGYGAVRLAFPGTIDPVMAGIPWTTTQFHLHGQEVTALPGGATPLAGSNASKNQAFRVDLRTYAFQYHFEWTRAGIDRMLEDQRPWITQHGASPDEIRQHHDEHYELYRHLGDRLCHNLANLLFPLDKRLGGRRGAVEATPVKNWQPAKS